MKTTCHPLLITAALLALTACATRTEHVHNTTPPPSQPPPSETPPAEPVPAIEASIASVTLGDDCPAPAAADRPQGARRAAGFAPAYCQQTAVQLALRVPAAHPGGVLEVTEVRLLTMEGQLLGTLDVRDAMRFDGGSYVAWDRALESGEHNVSLHTSGPDWQSIGQNGYGQSFRVEMDLSAGAQTETVEFAPASRESMVVT